MTYYEAFQQARDERIRVVIRRLAITVIWLLAVACMVKYLFN